MFAPDLADTVSGIDPVVFDELAELEAGYFWFVARSELIVGLANKYFPDARAALRSTAGPAQCCVNWRTRERGNGCAGPSYIRPD